MSYIKCGGSAIKQYSDNDREELEDLCRPVVQYLQRKHHPQMKVIITTLGAELVEGQIGVFYDY